MTSDEHISSLTLTGCGLVGFPTASQINCLTSPMIKTPRGIIRNARIDAAHIFAFTPIQSVPNWFQVLFTSLSGYFSTFVHTTIGLELYLELEVYASHIHARYPTHATQDSPLGHVHYTYGTFTLYGTSFQIDFCFVNLDDR